MKKEALIKSTVILSISLILVALLLFSVFGEHIVLFSSGAGFFSIDENTETLFNISVNNTDLAKELNITLVSIALPSSFVFIADSNGTNAGDHTFVNSSNFLNYSNDGLVMNNTLKYFWFNARVSEPGIYYVLVKTVNSTGWSIDSNLTVQVNDTTEPVAIQGTNPVDHYNDSDGSVVFDIKCTDNYVVSVLQLWTNLSGTWHANYTNLSYNNGTWLNVTLSNIPLSDYVWAVYCNDSSGNSNFSDNRTFNFRDAAIPTVTLTSPIAYANFSSTNVTFMCNATDAGGLSNITLYGNWTGWHANETVEKNGVSNSTILYKTLVTNSLYKYACMACDINGNCNFSTNRTFKIDSASPEVELLNPDNDEEYETTSSKKSVDFEFNVTDNFDIKNCSLWIEDKLNDTETEIIKYESNTISFALADGDWDWKIRCYDYSGNYDESSERTVKITVTTDSGGGGGSGDECTSGSKRCSGNILQVCTSGSWVTSITCEFGCANVACKNATNETQTLGGSGGSVGTLDNFSKLSNKSYNLSNAESINFTYGNETHSLTVKNLTSSAVTLELKSNPVNFVLKIGQSKEFNLDSDKKKDISITLVNITDNKANLLVDSISGSFSTTPRGEITIAPEAWKWIALALTIIVIAFAVATIVFFQRRKKRIKWKKRK